MRLLRAYGSAVLGKVASGTATQGLWPRDRKVGYQVIGEDRSRLLGIETVGEISRGGKRERRASNRAKREYTDLRLDLGKRKEQVVCHALACALAMRDVALREAEM